MSFKGHFNNTTKTCSAAAYIHSPDVSTYRISLLWSLCNFDNSCN